MILIGHTTWERGIRTIRDDHPLHLRYTDSGAMMDAGLREAVQSIKTAFPVSEVYVFGSYARGEERPDSHIDVLVVCTDVPQDLFDLTYQIRKHLHDVPRPRVFPRRARDDFRAPPGGTSVG